jgi:hypothetical protein
MSGRGEPLGERRQFGEDGSETVRDHGSIRLVRRPGTFALWRPADP